MVKHVSFLVVTRCGHRFYLPGRMQDLELHVREDMAPSTSKQSAASIDDPDHLRRFMEEMKKKRPTTFTSSQTQKTPSTTFDDAVTPVTEAASDKVDGSISPEKTSALVDPATPSGDSHFDVNGDHSVSSPLGGKTMVLPIRPKDNGMAPSDTMVNRFLQSPHLSGLKAPPPTPESGPHSSPLDPEEISGIIQISVESHLAGKKPMDGLAQSRHAPHVYASASSSPSQTKGILINADGYPRFKPPNRDLSPGSRREREASFDRISFAVADAPISSFLSRSEKAAHANYLAALEDRSSDKQPVLANGKDEVQPSTTNKARATSPAPLLGSHPNAPGTNIIDPRVPGQGLDLVSGTSNNQHSPKEVQKETHHKSVPKTFTDSSAATSVESAEATSATASVKNTTPLSNVSSGNETAISVPRNNGWIPPHLRLPGSSMGHRTTTSTNQSALEKSGKMADSDHILDPVHHEKVPTEDSWKIVASKQTAGPQYHETSSSKTFSISALNVQGIDMNASAHKGVRQPTPSNEAVNKQELPEGGCASSSKDTVSQSSSDQTFTKQDVISQTSDDTSKLPPHLRFLKSPTDKLSGASSKGTVAHTSVTPIATVTANQEPSSINVGEGKHSSAKLPQPGSSLEAAKPSSVEALYVSPNTGSTTPSITAAGAITAANNDLENTVFLGAWPKRGEREASGKPRNFEMKIRKHD